MKFEKNSYYGAYTEMATIGRDVEHGFRVVVTPDTGRDLAYFKVCNHIEYPKSTKVIRISFFKPECYKHSGDGKQLWELNSRQIKWLIEFMERVPSGNSQFHTNWLKTIYRWNEECDFIHHPDWDDKFPTGCVPDSELLRDPQFVPMNTPMPDYRKLEFDL